MTVKDSEIIALALDKYLGREDQWCQRAWAKDQLEASRQSSRESGAIMLALQ